MSARGGRIWNLPTRAFQGLFGVLTGHQKWAGEPLAYLSLPPVLTSTNKAGAAAAAVVSPVDLT